MHKQWAEKWPLFGLGKQGQRCKPVEQYKLSSTIVLHSANNRTKNEKGTMTMKEWNSPWQCLGLPSSTVLVWALARDACNAGDVNIARTRSLPQSFKVEAHVREPSNGQTYPQPRLRCCVAHSHSCFVMLCPNQSCDCNSQVIIRSRSSNTVRCVFAMLSRALGHQNKHKKYFFKEYLSADNTELCKTSVPKI